MLTAEIAPVVAPPASWARLVADLAAAHDLPRLLIPPAEVELVEGRWQLYPWIPRQDITALVEWVERLDDEIRAVARRPGSGVAVCGQLLGEPVALIADSDRIPPEPAPLSVTLLLELAALEQIAAGPDLPEAVLTLEQQADPLQVLLPPRRRPSPRPRPPAGGRP